MVHLAQTGTGRTLLLMHYGNRDIPNSTQTPQQDVMM